MRSHGRACLRQSAGMPVAFGTSRSPADLRVESRARFGNPRHGVPIDGEQPEPLRVAGGPLEVVPRSPVQVSAHVDARIDRIGDGVEMIAQVRGT